VELYTEDLPITTGSFMSLARADLFVPSNFLTR
jgi:hypothetical protein